MITTLTLNPAFDIHAYLPEFRAGHENLAEKIARDVGGEGINISRALTENKIPNRALVVLGSENAAEFRDGLKAEGLDFDEIVRPGRIRENITIHPAAGDETRLSFKGFACDASLLGKQHDTKAEHQRGNHEHDRGRSKSVHRRESAAHHAEHENQDRIPENTEHENRDADRGKVVFFHSFSLFKKMEQVNGIEPSRPAWEAGVLPLNYTCVAFLLYNIRREKASVSIKF